MEQEELWSAVAFQQQLLKEIHVTDLDKQNGFGSAFQAIRHNSTVAQELGLEPKPAPPPSKKEWDKVKELSKIRSDFKHPCPICRDEFGLQPQIILDCSHVFHETCLRNFEKMLKSKMCPICRKENYHKKKTTEGVKEYLEKCAIRIQAVWRGYRVRKEFRNQILQMGITPMQPRTKNRFLAYKLGDLSDQLDSAIGQKRLEAEQDITEAEESLEVIEACLKQFEKQHEKTVEWKYVIENAFAREVPECPICLQEMEVPLQYLVKRTQKLKQLIPKGKKHIPSPPSKAPPVPKQPKLIVLLSCSHLYHSKCVESLEYFLEEGTRPVCPICRSIYHKKIL